MKRLFGWILFIVLAMLLILLTNKDRANYAAIPLSDFVTQLETGSVKQVVIANDEVYGEFTTPQIILGDRVGKFRVPLPAGTTGNWTFQQWVLDHRQNAEVHVENAPNFVLQILLPLIPWLLIFAFIWFFVFRQFRTILARQKEPTRVYIVNLPGEPPLANEHQPPTPPPR